MTDINENNFRKTYVIWFLILVLSPISLGLATAIVNFTLPEDFVASLTAILKTGVIILTIWYGKKVGIKNVWAWALGFLTLLPFMVWISALILLTRKTGGQLKEKTVEIKK